MSAARRIYRHAPKATASTKIVIWKIGALGDVVMTTPLIRQLRRACPSARIDYLVGQSSAAVLRGNPHLDHVIVFDEAILFGRQIAGTGSITNILADYDVVFVLDKHWIFAVLAAIARVPQRIGFNRTWHEGLCHTKKVSYGGIRHEIHCYLSLAQAFGISVDFSDVTLELPASSPYPVNSPYMVLVNSGGVNPHERSWVRRIPQQLFSELVEACSLHGMVVFLGAPEEHSDYEQFSSASTLNLCGKTNLRQAWHVLEHAQAVYTTDTGLMHMAAALNGNVTAIFGPTHPLRKCPPGAKWVWLDQRAYDNRYELFGKIPGKTYFQGMTVGHIIDTPNRSCLATRTCSLRMNESRGEACTL